MQVGLLLMTVLMLLQFFLILKVTQVKLELEWLMELLLVLSETKCNFLASDSELAKMLQEVRQLL